MNHKNQETEKQKITSGKILSLRDRVREINLHPIDVDGLVRTMEMMKETISLRASTKDNNVQPE